MYELCLSYSFGKLTIENKEKSSEKDRKSFPAIALSTDSSCLTSLSNDYSFDIVFSRQCESLVDEGDVVIGISTSGNSINVLKGLETSKTIGAITVGLLGNNGGKIVVITSQVVKEKMTPSDLTKSH